MYLPPYSQLLKKAVAGRTAAGDGEVVLSIGLFQFLLQAALGTADFDEEQYLAANPDVRSKLAKSREFTPAQHFVGYGYFEGRRGGLPRVDEQWYLQTYPDVAQAVNKGQIASASEHFEIIGAGEGRAPSRAYVDVARQWKTLLQLG
jgi:hypothetical protein